MKTLLLAFLAPALALVSCGTPAPVETPGAPPVERIAFGSCARNDRRQPIWDAIAAQEPDLFLFIGDNVYADLGGVPESSDAIAQAYAELEAKAEWRRFRERCPVLATWDDHDYGKNDAGSDWDLKRESQTLFLDYFRVLRTSPRRQREGVYDARIFGPRGRRVQVILLDARYHRDPLTRRPDGTDGTGLGPYVPAPGGEGAILGEAQWAWLADQLEQPAQVRIIASSIQVVADEHGWESWGNFPRERRRLLRLIDDKDAAGVVFVSGDRHLIEISCDEEAGPYPMWDFTSSGLNQSPGPVSEPNRHQVGPVLRQPNFGIIRIDWDAPEVVLALEGRGEAGELLMKQGIPLGMLRE